MKTVILKPGDTITFWLFFVYKHIRCIYGTKECWNPSGSLRNRKYCFRRIDIDVQSFSKADLMMKLASFEVGVMIKSRIFLGFPYISTLSYITFYKGPIRKFLLSIIAPTSDDANFIIRSALEKLRTSISILRKQYF